MSSDRSWMYRHVGDKSRRLEDYLEGVEEFLKFAFSQPNCSENGKIPCPCSKCDFVKYKSMEECRMCLVTNGFTPNYTRWSRHGEPSEELVDPISDPLEEQNNWARDMVMEAAGPEFERNSCPTDGSREFYDLLEAADEALWEGCEEHTKLSATTLLLKIKSKYCVSNACFNAFLAAIKSMLPKEDKLPKSFYYCKTLMDDLGLPFENIHACENDCVLFRGKYAHLDACPKCGEARYKNRGELGKRKNIKPIANKVLRYFPLIPRLKRLYLSSKTAEHMRWHKEKRLDIPGEMRHPADANAWKDFDHKFPEFAKDSRSIRLILATDGFNPFGQSSKSHSTWPVFIVPYNLPPWMCMKDEHMFMTLLIPGPKAPGKELDVYLEPLIEELETLWDTGVDTYDAYSGEDFNMRAALLGTVSDFPALGVLKGYSTHGCLSCPVCMEKDVAFYLPHGRKPSYFGCHRRWLDHSHKWRDVDKNKFNKKVERRGPPPGMSGSEELEFVSQFEDIPLGKGKGNEVKPPGFGIDHNFTKKSVFFRLPYWSSLLIPHNLDVMHIEKNVFDNVFNTVMNVKGKTKDHPKARMDLKELGIRPELHLKESSQGKVTMPKARYTLTNDEVKKVCSWLKTLKVPDRYASNISRCVDIEKSKVHGLKSHDCHVLMERFLPIAFRDFLPKAVWEPINALCQFFKDICSKVYKEEHLEKVEKLIIETLCQLEMIFPPSFFDSMEHLPIHLAYQARMGGPVQYRWMYPFERRMCYLKKRVRNKASPEGSIAEAYRIDELVYFCTRYFDLKVQTQFSQPARMDDGADIKPEGRLSVFTYPGRPIGKEKRVYISDEDYNAATLYVLSNCEEVYEFMDEHMSLLKELHPNFSDERLEQEQNKTFVKWFEARVADDDKIDPRLKRLAKGPSMEITLYDGFIVNGFKFLSKEVEPGRATQNSGVLVKGSTYNAEAQDYYGHLEKVVELDYYGKGNQVFLFKCVWYDDKKGTKVDKYGFTTVDTKSRLKSYEPFVIAAQALQVFYAKSVKSTDLGWSTVITTKARDTYDVVEISDLDTYQEDASTSAEHIVIEDDNLVLLDEDKEGEEFDLEHDEEVEGNNDENWYHDDDFADDIPQDEDVDDDFADDIPQDEDVDEDDE